MSITYELDGPGWARARIADERQSVDLTASYIPEALGNLATAVLQGYGVREYGEKWVEFPFPGWFSARATAEPAEPGVRTHRRGHGWG